MLNDYDFSEDEAFKSGPGEKREREISDGDGDCPYTDYESFDDTYCNPKKSEDDTFSSVSDDMEQVKYEREQLKKVDTKAVGLFKMSDSRSLSFLVDTMVKLGIADKTLKDDVEKMICSFVYQYGNSEAIVIGSNYSLSNMFGYEKSTNPYYILLRNKVIKIITQRLLKDNTQESYMAAHAFRIYANVILGLQLPDVVRTESGKVKKLSR